MEAIPIIIGIIAFILSIIPIIFALKFLSYVKRYFVHLPKRNYSSKTSVIIPCKGIDPGFKKNISALFNQDHLDYELIFITATADDPAYPVLADIISNHPDSKAKLHTAGIVPGRSQKINNQISGISYADDNTKIFVFVDSDARPNDKFLTNLITPLSNESIGITTGFRWYLPIKKGFFSFLRSTWNCGGIVFLSEKKSNYAWGGAMAIKKNIFHTCDVLSYWDKALSDDMTISLAVRKRGLDIYFVPTCLVTIHEDCTFFEMMEWTNRQTIISKIYHPGLWKSILFVHGTGNIILGLGMLLIVLWSVSVIESGMILVAAILMLSIIPMEMLNGVFIMPSIIKMLPEHEKQIKKSGFIYCLMAPIASFLALINSIYSLFTNKISWRGITYEMKSVNETIIIDHGKDD